MAKISKRKLKLHNDALALVRSDEALSLSQKEFVLENYKPYATHNVTETNAFFTPMQLAIAATIEMPNPAEYGRKVRVLDICAGMGVLSFALYHYSGNRFNADNIELVCIELEAEYIEVGKKILPEATWIQADILNPETFKDIGHFDCFISNPPFMKLDNYKGTYTVGKLGTKVSEYGVMIVPQCNCPFKYSGQDFYSEEHNPDYNKYEDAECVGFTVSCVDTEAVDEAKWDDVNIVTEIVIVDDLMKNPRKYPTPSML